MLTSCQSKLVTLSATKPELVGLKLTSTFKMNSEIAFLFIHGAGLDFKAPLYLALASKLVEGLDVYLAGMRSSGFLSYNKGFRKPLGWAYHRVTEACSDCQIWIDWISSLGYKKIILGGHSWGALLALASAKNDMRAYPVILISPLPSMRNIIEVNYGGESGEITHIINDIATSEDQNLVPTCASAPFCFLSAGTIRDLASSSWGLASFLELWKGPILTIVGDMEHAKLLDEVVAAVKDLPHLSTFIKIPKEGHFYSTGAEKLAKAIKEWITTINMV